jgi:hypothetical protein
MKKIFSFAMVTLFISFVLISCNKEFECHCDTADGEETEFYKGIKKSEAEEICESFETFLKITDETADCHLD